MTNFRLFCGVCAVGLLLGTIPAGRPANAQSGADRQHLSQLGPGDSVSIQIFGEAEVANVYVGDDGTISVPLVGNIPVAGMTPVEAAARVAKALKDGGFYLDPNVTIRVTQQSSQLVSVLGEVQNIGRYPITPRTTIIELLTEAGGVKVTASDTGYLLRTDEDGHTRRYSVKLSGLTDVSDTLPTPLLRGGDSLIVPHAENYFVQGEVATPGTFPMEPGLTVIQAIAHAGGINERGSERRIEIRRLGKDGQYKVFHVKPGDPVQAGDMIRVKESIF
jgi:polysaccharide export outer membrane protein